MVQSQCASSGTARNIYIFFSRLFIYFYTCLPSVVAHVWFRIETGLCLSTDRRHLSVSLLPPLMEWKHQWLIKWKKNNNKTNKQQHLELHFTKEEKEFGDVVAFCGRKQAKRVDAATQLATPIRHNTRAVCIYKNYHTALDLSSDCRCYCNTMTHDAHKKNPKNSWMNEGRPVFTWTRALSRFKVD